MTDTEPTGEGTAAVLQGMMTMLGEALQRLEKRLVALESAVAAQEEGHAAALRVDHQVEADFRVAQLEERLQESIAANHGIASTLKATVDRLEDVAGAVDTIGYGLASLADTISGSDADRASRPTVSVEEVHQLTVEVREVAADVQALGGGLQQLGTGVRQILASSRDRQAGVEALRQEISSLGKMIGDLGSRMRVTEDQVTALLSAVTSMNESLSSQVDEASSSIGHKATKAGRRLASDLGLFARAKRSPEEDELDRDR